MSHRRAGTWSDWAEADAHVSSRELAESHTLEFKSEDYKSTDAGRKELAKDVAALAIDGGALIIGVVEDPSTGLATGLSSVVLHGVVERIDQICEHRITPPLTVSISDGLRDPADATRGLVVIEVPATGLPHMVDYRYVARSNRTVRYLEHPEVVRLLSRHDRDLEAVEEQMVRAYASTGAESMAETRMILTVMPVPKARPDLLRAAMNGPSGTSWPMAAMSSAEARVKTELADEGLLSSLVSPSWHWHNAVQSAGTRRIPRGLARQFVGHGHQIHLIETEESGLMRFATHEVYTLSTGDDTYSTFYTSYALGFLINSLAVADAIMDEVGFRGSLGLGVEIRGIDGIIAEPRDGMRRRSRGYLEDQRGYRENEYRQIASATSVELHDDLPHVIDRLMGPMLRSLGYGDRLRSNTV